MNKRLLVLAGIVVSAALARLVPHPPNVTPVAAMALFGGAYLVNRRLAYLLPLAAMLLSDVILGFLLYGTTLLRSQPVVYACILATAAMGRLIRNRRSAWQVGGVTLASSVMFYLVTNFAVWADGRLYARTWDGLMICYVAGIPFFRNSLAGDMVFSAVLFGGFILLESHVTSLGEETELSPV
jgi:hypothetical protein